MTRSEEAENLDVPRRRPIQNNRCARNPACGFAADRRQSRNCGKRKRVV